MRKTTACRPSRSAITNAGKRGGFEGDESPPIEAALGEPGPDYLSNMLIPRLLRTIKHRIQVAQSIGHRNKKCGRFVTLSTVICSPSKLSMNLISLKLTTTLIRPPSYYGLFGTDYGRTISESIYVSELLFNTQLFTIPNGLLKALNNQLI